MRCPKCHALLKPLYDSRPHGRTDYAICPVAHKEVASETVCINTSIIAMDDKSGRELRRELLMNSLPVAQRLWKTDVVDFMVTVDDKPEVVGKYTDGWVYMLPGVSGLLRRVPNTTKISVKTYQARLVTDKETLITLMHSTTLEDLLAKAGFILKEESDEGVASPKEG